MALVYDPTQDTSQDGTVKTIFDYFNARAAAHNLLVDVGAYGKDLSNTHGLLARGWKGLLIEANPERIDIIKREFAGLDFKVLNIGIGDAEETLPLYLHKGHGKDAQDKDRDVGGTSFFKGWFGHWETGRTININIFPLCTVLDSENYPKDFDLLSVDTEGFDKRIIEHLLSKSAYRPRLIVAEFFSFRDGFDLFTHYGYSLIKDSGIGGWGTIIFSKDP